MTTKTKTARVRVEWDNATEWGHAAEHELPPRDVDVPHELVWNELDGVSAEGEVADWLSDEHGWCVEGWEVLTP